VSTLFCLMPLSLLSVPSTMSPVPVILDTDIGDDIDDTWALTMLLGCPQVDLKLIVTASDDTPTKLRLVAKMLQQIGRTDIPIAAGKKTSDAKINQAKWLGDYDISQYPGTIYDDGVQAIVDCIEKSKEPVTLLVIGPQTNIKAALERDPLIAKNARVVAMAGSIYKGYGGADEPAPEYNVKKDVAAAKAVFAAPWDITMAPLDVCGEFILKDFWYEHVRDSKTPRAVMLMENYAQWANRSHYPEDESSVLYDTVAAYLTYDDTLCKMETVKLHIDEEGYTRPHESRGRPVHCAIDWKDRDSFADLLATAVTGHEAQEPKE